MERKAKEEARLRRLQRAAQPSRDAATFIELRIVLNEVRKLSKTVGSFVVSGDSVCFILLFLFGLRVSNMLLLRVSHIKRLRQPGVDCFHMPLIKTGQQNVVRTFAVPDNA
uniref:hypothetical protein n=1 Tax=Gormaniella terricola TaxID=2904618 RepID=UPI0021CCC2A8|nr:hypothetical protein ODF01_mgp08 [Gormaniella terricola]UWV18320.1 hypothetical protein [Gormaniella terricola]